MKYIIEITENGIKKTFIDQEGKEFSEQWVRNENGSCGTTGAGITSQLEDAEHPIVEELQLFDALDYGDLQDIWDEMAFYCGVD